DVHTAGVERADVAVVQVEDAGVVLGFATHELAPDLGAVVTALRSLFRTDGERQTRVKTGVFPRAHEPGAAEVRAVRRHQHAAGPQVEGRRGLELGDEVQDRRAHAEAPRTVAAGIACTRRDGALEVRLPGEHRRDVAGEARLDVDLVEARAVQAGTVG